MKKTSYGKNTLSMNSSTLSSPGPGESPMSGDPRMTNPERKVSTLRGKFRFPALSRFSMATQMTVASRESALMAPFPAPDRFSTTSTQITALDPNNPAMRQAHLNQKLGKYNTTDTAKQLHEMGMGPRTAEDYDDMKASEKKVKKARFQTNKLEQQLLKAQKRAKIYKISIVVLALVFIILGALFFVVN